MRAILYSTESSDNFIGELLNRSNIRAFKRNRHFPVVRGEVYFFLCPPRLPPSLPRNHISSASVVQFRDNKYRRTGGSELCWKEKKVIENIALAMVSLQKCPKRSSFQRSGRTPIRIFEFHGNYEVAPIAFFFFWLRHTRPFFRSLSRPLSSLPLFFPRFFPPFSLPSGNVFGHCS